MSEEFEDMEEEEQIEKKDTIDESTKNVITALGGTVSTTLEDRGAKEIIENLIERGKRIDNYDCREWINLSEVECDSYKKLMGESTNFIMRSMKVVNDYTKESIFKDALSLPKIKPLAEVINQGRTVFDHTIIREDGHWHRDKIRKIQVMILYKLVENARQEYALYLRRDIEIRDLKEELKFMKEDLKEIDKLETKNEDLGEKLDGAKTELKEQKSENKILEGKVKELEKDLKKLGGILTKPEKIVEIKKPEIKKEPEKIKPPEKELTFEEQLEVGKKEGWFIKQEEERKFYKCLKCSYKWNSLKEKLPVNCPECKNRKWNK